MPSWTSSSAWCAVRRWRPPRKGDGSWPRGRWPPACRWRSPRTPRRVAIGLTSRPRATWSPSRGPPRSTAPSTSRRASKGCAKSGRSRSRSRRSRLSSPSRQRRRSNSGQADDALAWPLGRERGVRGAVGRLGDAKLEALALTASHDPELDGLAHLGVRREALEMVVVLDWRAVERDDHVVLRQARHRGGAPRVDAGSPAAVAGLAQNNVIVTFDSTPVEDYHHLQRLSADAEVGKTVKLGVVRSRERKSLELRIAEAPDRAADTTLPSEGPR